jgi:hypothetical protein
MNSNVKQGYNKAADNYASQRDQFEREKHVDLLRKFASFMPNGGYILLTMGAEEWEGFEENFHGAKMFWSHFGAEKNTEIVKNAGFEIILNKIDTSSGEKHHILIAKI